MDSAAPTHYEKSIKGGQTENDEQMQGYSLFWKYRIDTGKYRSSTDLYTQDDLGITNDVAEVISDNEYEWDDVPTCTGEDIYTAPIPLLRMTIVRMEPSKAQRQQTVVLKFILGFRER